MTDLDRADGLISEVRIWDHSIVKAGELLVRLDPAPYELALAKAEADVDSARAEPWTNSAPSSMAIGVRSSRIV